MTTAGERNRLVVIQRPVMTINDLGEETRTWGGNQMVWAKMTPISDGERWRAAQVQANISARFVIPWGYDVTTRDRLVMEDDTAYEVVAVKEIGRRQGQEITAAVRSE